MKPTTALLKQGEDFMIPAFSNNIHHELELVLEISKMGKHIPETEASEYYERIGSDRKYCWDRINRKNYVGCLYYN